MKVLIHRYGKDPIMATFTGDLKPNGFNDYRIIDAWTKTVCPGNTGWELIRTK